MMNSISSLALLDDELAVAHRNECRRYLYIIYSSVSFLSNSRKWCGLLDQLIEFGAADGHESGLLH